MTTPPFVEFPKLARLSRGCVITEKIDGTNAQIYIMDSVEPVDLTATETALINDKVVSVVGNFWIYAGSRSRWITPADDNFGFATWVRANATELAKLGPGSHFGEWWGAGIQRRYGQTEKKFSLFNRARWSHNDRPACCDLVPLLYAGPFTDAAVNETLENLRANGSAAAQGFMKPEGIVVYHTASRTMFKKTLEKDDVPKSMVEELVTT